MTMVLLNVASEKLTLVELQASRQSEGGVTFHQGITIINPTPYFGASHDEATPHESYLHMPTYAGTILRIAAELLFVAMLTALIMQEVEEMRSEYREAGSIRAYFNFFNVTDLTGYALQVAMGVYWLKFVGLTHRFHPQAHYQVFDDEMAVGRILAVNDEMAVLQDQLSQIKLMGVTIDAYLAQCMLSIIVMVVQMIQKLDFHPRMGIISRTVANAKVDLRFHGGLTVTPSR